MKCDLGASHAENHNALDLSFTRIVALFSFMGSPQARASNTWSRAKGAVHSLHDTAVALRRRIDDVDPMAMPIESLVNWKLPFAISRRPSPAMLLDNALNMECKR